MATESDVNQVNKKQVGQHDNNGKVQKTVQAMPCHFKNRLF